MIESSVLNRTTVSSDPRRLNVVMFQRHPLPGRHSVERVFEDVRSAMPPDIRVETRVLPFESRGVVKRVRNMLFARRHRTEVNHIVGDVHYLALLLPRRSTVLTILDLGTIDKLKGLRRSLFILLWYRLPARRATLIAVISEWTRSELVSLLPRAAGKTVVVHCPVPPSFERSPSPHHERPVVLQVGTGSNKNLTRVIEAVSGMDLHLRIIGRLDQSQRGQLAGAGVDYSNVWMLTDAQMREEYAGCDLVIFASTYEGFGLPILEAQATGRPVITSSVASMPEVAGTGALFVDPLDVAQIRAALSSLLEDQALYGSLVQLGFENLERFAARAIAERYADIYRTIQVEDEE